MFRKTNEDSAKYVGNDISDSRSWNKLLMYFKFQSRLFYYILYFYNDLIWYKYNKYYSWKLLQQYILLLLLLTF